MQNSVKTGLWVVGAFVGGVYVGYSKAREILFETMINTIRENVSISKIKKSDKEEEAE